MSNARMPLPQGSSDTALMTVDDVARFLGCSRSHIWRCHSAGLIPAPVHLLRLCRWRRAECQDWVKAGMPPRCRWAWTPCVEGRR